MAGPTVDLFEFLTARTGPRHLMKPQKNRTKMSTFHILWRKSPWAEQRPLRFLRLRFNLPLRMAGTTASATLCRALNDLKFRQWRNISDMKTAGDLFPASVLQAVICRHFSRKITKVIMWYHVQDMILQSPWPLSTLPAPRPRDAAGRLASRPVAANGGLFELKEAPATCCQPWQGSIGIAVESKKPWGERERERVCRTEKISKS